MILGASQRRLMLPLVMERGGLSLPTRSAQSPNILIRIEGGGWNEHSPDQK